MSEFAQVSRRLAGAAETAAANRSWWDAEAADDYAEHGRFLGDADFVWGPEGWRESELHLLGEVAGRRVLEIGAGLPAADLRKLTHRHTSRVLTPRRQDR